MPPARTIRNAAILGGLGLAVVDAFEAAQYRRSAAKGYQLQDPPTPCPADFARRVERLTIALLRQGNRVTVLRNGCEIFPAMLEVIQQAKETVNFATHCLLDRLHRAAVRRGPGRTRRRRGRGQHSARHGRGGQDGQFLIDQLKDAGAEVAWFRPPKWYTLHKLNNRTHRKILVVDGKVGFTGGVGIAEEWTGNCEDAEHWRDTHVRVEGPVVRNLLSGFVDNWAEATGCILSGRQHLPDVASFDDGIQAQVTRSTAQKGSTDAEQLFYTAIACARERIWLTHRLLRHGAHSSMRCATRSAAGWTCACRPTAPTSTRRSSARLGGAAMSSCWPAAGGTLSTSHHAPCQGLGGGLPLGHRRVGQLRQPGAPGPSRCAPASWPARSCEGSYSRPPATHHPDGDCCSYAEGVVRGQRRGGCADDEPTEMEPKRTIATVIDGDKGQRRATEPGDR